MRLFAIAHVSVAQSLWDESGNACVFCEDCMVRWWGFDPAEPPDDDDWR